MHRIILKYYQIRPSVFTSLLIITSQKFRSVRAPLHILDHLFSLALRKKDCAVKKAKSVHRPCHIVQFGRYKIGKHMFPLQFNIIANTFLIYQTLVINFYLLTAELRCKLQENLHCITGPYVTVLTT